MKISDTRLSANLIHNLQHIRLPQFLLLLADFDAVLLVQLLENRLETQLIAVTAARDNLTNEVDSGRITDRRITNFAIAVRISIVCGCGGNERRLRSNRENSKNQFNEWWASQTEQQPGGRRKETETR
jgi:hypothetical protein